MSLGIQLLELQNYFMQVTLFNYVFGLTVLI